MGKLLVRITIIFSCVYFITVCIFAWHGRYFFNDFYIVLFEICVCVIMTSQGKYHCEYMKYSAYGITLGDGLTRLDGAFCILPCNYFMLIPLALPVVGVASTFTLALYHFYKVQRSEHKRNEIHGRRTRKDK